MEPKRLTDIITKSNDLSRFTQKIEQLSKISQAVKNHLEPSLARQCQVANLRDGILILSTHSSIWGHQLRFQEIELLSVLRATPEWCGLKSVQSRVVPLSSSTQYSAEPKQNLSMTKTPLSIKSAAHLEDVAQHIQYPHLKQAFLKLASYAITGYK